jgi:hypothetical protein
MKIVVNCKIVEEVLGPFLGGILVPFLGSIFAPFLAFVRFAICLFYGTFSMSMVVFGPFLDVFWTVHFITILPTLGPPGARWVTGHCCRWLAWGLVTSCWRSAGLILGP